MAKFKKAKKVKSTAPDGFKDKYWNKLSEPWRDAALTKTTEELEQETIKAIRGMVNTSSDMKADKKIEVLSQELKELKSFYTETIGIEEAKIHYCVYLMNTRGIKVSKNVKDAVAEVEEAEDEEASS